MAATDIFPLTPDFPIEIAPRSRKIQGNTISGKVYTRSEGTDIWRTQLHGTGPSADIKTLINFYERLATSVFTFQDKSFSSGQINRICVFVQNGDESAIGYRMLAYEYWEWTALIAQTTQA